MLERFQKVSNLNIIVLGDIILDEYITGDMTRKSAEAPIYIVDQSHVEYILGGSANVATNLSSLGAHPILIGTIGADETGKTVKNLLESKKITNHLIAITKPTSVKRRVIVDRKQVFRIDHEDTADIPQSIELNILSQIKNIISGQSIDAIVLQDYNKGIFTNTMIKSVIQLAQEYGVKIFVDPKHKNYWKYKNVDYFKPNKNELYSALSDDSLPIEKAIVATRNRLNCGQVICTLAEDGIALFSEEGYIHNPTKKIDLIDVSGAGDSTLSMIVISILLGYDSKETLLLSNAAGRSSCKKLGVSTISIEDISSNL